MDKLTPLEFLPVEGLVKQEIVTYFIKNGRMHKTTFTRRYQAGADWIDSSVTEVLYAAN
jgi:hypothetical protein